MSGTIQPDDLPFFTVLAAAGSLTAAARDLGITTPAVSKHLAAMEARIGVSLVSRTTRRMSLTPEGEVYAEHARRILSEIGELEELLGLAKAKPKGLLRINATLGFGRSHIAPLISRFVKLYPEVDVQLQLSVSPPPLMEDSFDICIRFGAPPDTRVIARKLASNRRLLCASPAYLKKHGAPTTPADLAKHRCIGIRQGEEAYGLWRLTAVKGRNAQTESVKTTGNLTTNDGEIAVHWAVEGHGILLRAEWDVARYLANGRLIEVLGAFKTPDADIYAVYPPRHQSSARVRKFIDFVEISFSERASAT